MTLVVAGLGACATPGSASPLQGRTGGRLSVLPDGEIAVIGPTGFRVRQTTSARWSNVRIPGIVNVVGGYVLNRSDWWAAGACGGHPVIAATRDGGRHWRKTTLPHAYPDGFGQVRFSFKSATTGWLSVDTVHGSAFASADLYATNSGGAHWRLVGSFPFTGPILLRRSHVYAIAGRGGRSLETSGDGGKSWRRVPLSTPADLAGRARTLAFVAARDGVAVEVRFAANNNRRSTLVIETSRDGSTWSATAPVQGDFADYGFGAALPASRDPDGGWIVTNGKSVFHSAGGGWRVETMAAPLPGVVEIAAITASSAFALVEQTRCGGSKRSCASRPVVEETRDGGLHWEVLGG